jgi:hypothetical protein
MNDKDDQPDDVVKPPDEATDDLASAERRQGLRRSGQDRRNPNSTHIRVPDRRQKRDRRTALGRRKDDLE